MNAMTKRMEMIFAHAAALQQSGRLKSTIYCRKRSIYVLNQDRTVLIHFPLRSNEPPFKRSLSFYANDYDSTQLTEQDGHICFVQRSGVYERQKSCQVPDITSKEIVTIFNQRLATAKKTNKVTMTKDFLTCLDESLSHIEFKGVKGHLVALQRNIYSGTIIKIEKATAKGLGLFTEEVKDFKVFGLRTNDFVALFTFASSLSFFFAGKDVVVFENTHHSMPFTGMLSRCVYDEIGVEHGR